MWRQGLFQIYIHRGKALLQKVGLGGKVVIKGPGGDSGCGADIPDGHFFKAALPGELSGCRQDGPAGLLGLEPAALLIICVQVRPLLDSEKTHGIIVT